MDDEIRSRPLQGMKALSNMNWIHSRGVRLDKADLPATLKDVIFIKRGEVDIGKRVGGGSFGDVYKGRLYDQDAAMKVFKVQNSVARVTQLVGSDDGVEMQEQGSQPQKRIVDLVMALEREVRVLKSISFRTIVQFYGVCLEPAAIVTEYCANKSLFDYIGLARSDQKYAENLPWRRRLQIAYDAACGMHYLHSREMAVFHRDLKSPNLLLDEQMNCKICDFNTARFVGTKAVTNSIASNNPLWLAPEILQGFPFTGASDVYPFGIILWELMTWMVPFEVNGEAKNPHAVMFGVVFKDDRPEIPKNEELIGGPCPVYRDYCNLIQQCWHREAGKRPSFADIVQTLDKLIVKVHQLTVSHPIKRKTSPDRSERPAFSGRLRMPWKSSSMLKRSKNLSKDIEDQIKLKNPDIEASWEASYEELLRDLDQLPTPFAKGLPSMMSNESFGGSVPPIPGYLPHAAGGPRSDSDMDLQTYLSGASTKNRGIQSILGISSSPSTAQSRWNKIRDVVTLISARKRAHAMLSKLGVKPPPTPDASASAKVVDSETQESIGESLQIINENQPVHDPSPTDVKKPESRWNFLRNNICPDGRPNSNELWDFLARHMSAQRQLHASGSLRPLPSYVLPLKPVCARAMANWALVREILELHGLDGYPRTPKSWQPLLDVLYGSENAHLDVSKPNQKPVVQSGTSMSSK